MAMLVAEEMGAKLSDVDVVLADARPELRFNQLTAASVSTRELFSPVRLTASEARLRLLRTYAEEFGYRVDKLKVRDSTVLAPDGKSTTFGSLTRAAASLGEPVTERSPKPFDEYTLVGKPTTRKYQLNHITGKTKFCWDLDVPGARSRTCGRTVPRSGRNSNRRSLPRALRQGAGPAGGAGDRARGPRWRFFRAAAVL